MQSYTANLMGNRDPYYSSKYELTLPTHLAIIAMSRSIRCFLKRRSSFVAAFIMPPKADVHAYKMAAKWLNINVVMYGFNINAPMTYVSDAVYQRNGGAYRFERNFGFRTQETARNAFRLALDQPVQAGRAQLFGIRG